MLQHTEGDEGGLIQKDSFTILRDDLVKTTGVTTPARSERRLGC